MEMKKIRQWLAPILTGMMYIAIVLIMATTFSFVFKIDTDFWTTVGIGIVIMVLTTLIWLPSGVEKGSNLQKVINNTNIYNGRANYIINKQLFKNVKEFTIYKNNEHKKRLITEKLSTVTLDYDVYLKYITKLNGEEKENFDAMLETLSKKQLKMLKRLKEKEIRFEKLEPAHLTVGKTNANRLVPKNQENTFKSFKVVLKVLWGLFMGAFMTFIVIQQNDKFGIAEIIQITLWSFSILFNIYSAIVTGYNSVVKYRNLYMIEQSNLCAEFFDFAGISVEDVDATFIVDKQKEAIQQKIEKDKLVDTIPEMRFIIPK